MTNSSALVIDESTATRRFLAVVLASHGYDVVEARDGRGAIDAFARYHPRVVIQDLTLPDMDGVELMRQLRALPGGSEARILALSGWINRMLAAQRDDVGFDAYLAKPIA